MPCRSRWCDSHVSAWFWSPFWLGPYFCAPVRELTSTILSLLLVRPRSPSATACSASKPPDLPRGPTRGSPPSRPACDTSRAPFGGGHPVGSRPPARGRHG